MSPKRKIRAKDIVTDVRGGITNEQLMEKYQLSPSALKGIFDKLIAARALLELELTGREADLVAASSDTSIARAAARSYVMFRLPIYDLDDMTVEGQVHNLSETDLVAIGIRADVGDVKSLLIQADEFADVYPFTFDAVCSAVEPDNRAVESAVSFDITSISEVGLTELRKLCQLLGIS